MTSTSAGPGRPREPLRAAEVRHTLEELTERIATRFPDRNLRVVAGDLLAEVDAVEASAGRGVRRVRTATAISRALMVAVAALTAVALVLAARDTLHGRGVSDSVDVLGLAETTISDLVYAAVAAFFLWSFPQRLQRGRLLALLHQLRSTAHVIDMHQLSKDPEQLRPTYVATPASRPLGVSREEVERYLDYCSELLSLVGKTAALCAEVSQDPLVLDTVNSVELLTVGLSRKIWQKISTLPAPEPAVSAASVSAASVSAASGQPMESSTSS